MLEPSPMENENEAHSSPVKIENLDEALSESQAAPPSPQLAFHLLAPDSGYGNLDLPPSPPPLPLVSESVVPEIRQELSMEMTPPVHQITNEPPLKKRRNMHQKSDQLIEACKIEVETGPLVSGTAEIDTHGEEQMEAQQMEDEVSDRSPAEITPQESIPRNLETHASSGSDPIVSTGQRGTITQDTPSGAGDTAVASAQGDVCHIQAQMERPRRMRKPNPRTSQETVVQPISTDVEPIPQQKIRNTRGPSKGRDVEPVVEKRPKLTIISSKEFDAEPDTKQIATTVRVVVCNNVQGPYTSFNEFPTDVRKQCLQEFLYRFRWADEENSSKYETVFHNIAVIQYAAAMTTARSNCRKKYGDEWEKWKELRPLWLGDQKIWESMCERFGSPTFQKVSKQNSENRMALGNENIVKHVAGTRSTFRHAKIMKQNSGNEPTYEEVFKITHVKKQTGEFVDARSQNVHDNYIFNKANPKHPDETDQEKWLRAVGGVSHGRVYGVGSMIVVAEIHAKKRIRFEDFPPPPSPPYASEPVYTQEEVDAMILDERRRNKEDINRMILEERRRNFYNISVICRHVGLEPPQMDEDPSSAASFMGSQSNEVELGAQGLDDDSGTL